MLDRNRFIGLEYPYADLGKTRPLRLAALPAATSAFSPDRQYREVSRAGTFVRFKFNYHFNEPIMARY